MDDSSDISPRKFQPRRAARVFKPEELRLLAHMGVRPGLQRQAAQQQIQPQPVAQQQMPPLPMPPLPNVPMATRDQRAARNPRPADDPIAAAQRQLVLLTKPYQTALGGRPAIAELLQSHFEAATAAIDNLDEPAANDALGKLMAVLKTPKSGEAALLTQAEPKLQSAGKSEAVAGTQLSAEHNQLSPEEQRASDLVDQQKAQAQAADVLLKLRRLKLPYDQALRRRPQLTAMLKSRYEAVEKAIAEGSWAATDALAKLDAAIKTPTSGEEALLDEWMPKAPKTSVAGTPLAAEATLLGMAEQAVSDLKEEQLAAHRRSIEPPKQGSLKVDISNKTPIAMKRAFKGEENKKTCLMEIGGKTFVLKGGSGNTGDHLAASDFINKLGLKGVMAPVSRTLDPEERSIVANALPKDNQDARELATSLGIIGPDGYSTGLVSEPCDGLAIDKLMPPLDAKRAQKAMNEALQSVKDMEQNDAWKTVTLKMLADSKKNSEKIIKERTELLPTLISSSEKFRKIKSAEPPDATDEQKKENEKNLKVSEDKVEVAQRAIENHTKKLNSINEFLSAVTPEVRNAALAWLKKERGAAPVDVALIKVLTFIDGGKKIEKVIEEIEEEAVSLAAERKVLADFAKSAEGIEAFAGVAVSDLFAGMDDRILSKKNGGNFLFDPQKKQLQCIDNHKQPLYSLNVADTATDDVKKANFDAWKSFVTGSLQEAEAVSLDEMILEKIYGKNTALDGLVTFDDEKKKAQAQAKIHELLVAVVAKVAGNKDFGGPASERAAFLKNRLLDDIFKIEA